MENYTTEWQTQSEMTYDGLGNRLEVTTYSDGEGNTTRYVLDGGAELTAIGAESSTYYLYGLGAIGTLGESWSYMLQDGAGSTRQLVDEEGAVNLSVSYTPWGDTMEIYGSGMLNLGYLGGVYDAGTGLIYMGNGQYYDPSTGRFLTRGAQQDQSNPYTPWNSDPAGMLIAPLALLALVFGRKKTRTKFDQFIILFVIVVSVGLSVSACNGGSTPAEQPSETPTPTETPVNTPVPDESGTDNGKKPTETDKPTITPIPSECYLPISYTLEEWTEIARVLYYEGASSFSENIAPRVFDRQLWALRSLRQRKVENMNRSYIDMVTDCGLISACDVYGKIEKYVAPYYIDRAKSILSEDDCINEPSEFVGREIHWISPQNFPRYNTSNLVMYNEAIFYTSKENLASCSQEEGNPDKKGCQLNDMRLVTWVRKYAINSLTVEEFVDLGKMGPYQSGYDSWFKWAQESTELYGQHECYWKGVYFVEESNWDILHAGKKLNPPKLEEVKDLQCQSYTAIQN